MKSKIRHRSGRTRHHRRSREEGPDPLGAVFGALSHPTRRAILARLARGECSVTILVESLAVSQRMLSKYLRVLETSGLITGRKAGRWHYYRLRADALRRPVDWIQQQACVWEQQFDALAKD